MLLPLSIFSGPAFAQGTIGNIPLSRFGLGLQVPEGNIRTRGMGGAGAAMPSFDFVNQSNPALIAFNRTTNMDLGIDMTRHWMTDTSLGKALTGGGWPAFVSFTFPVSKKLVMNASIKPYSFTYYSVYTDSYIADANGNNTGTIYRQTVSANGSISRASVSAGYTVTPTFLLGLQTSYLYGSLDNYNSFYPGYSYNELTRSQSKINTNELLFKPGAFMRIWNDTATNTAAGLSVSYEFATGLNSLRNQTIDHLNPNTGALINVTDTLSSDERGKIVIPGTFNIALSLQRSLKWGIGLDFSMTQSSKFRSFGESQGMKDSYSLSFGGEYLPNYSSPSLYKRITYRGGLNFSQTPYTANGNQVSDMSVSVGGSVPITRQESKFTRPFVNFALSFGKMGRISSNTLQDNYIKFSIGATMNDLMWFNRYRVD